MDAQKLAKVLALAGSDNEAEAVGALRTAKRLLAAQGADFVEVARRFADTAPAAAGSSQAQVEDLEDAIFDLRNEIRHLRAENERLRQNRAATPNAEAPSLADAARDAADAIRLRAELAELRDRMEATDAEILHLRAHASATDEQLRAALKRVEDLDGRRMRLEAENRRLSTANHALGKDLEEARRETPLPSLPVPPADRPSKRAAKHKPGASQYALF